MSQTSKKLMLFSLVLSIVSGCGMDLDETDSARSGEVDQAVVNQANGDVPGTPSGAKVVLAKNAVGTVTPFSPPGPLGLILIDRTGSMTAIRPSTGHTRCADAVTQAQQQLTDMVTEGVMSFAVWTFAGSSVTQVTPGYVDQTTASAAINGLSAGSCTGSTPLAFAMCAAAQDLALHRTPSQGPSAPVAFLAVSTDGGENNSPGSPLLTIGNTNCSGLTGDITTAGTWENNVNNYINNTIDNIKVDNMYWIDPALGTSLRTSAAAGCNPSTNQCDNAFFSSLSNSTGGNFRQGKDTTATYPCSGSGCPVPDSTNVGNRFSFTAVNTNSDTVNTANYSVYLLAGETLNAGCSVPGTSLTGDTILRVFSPFGPQVAFNDDSCGILSNVTFTAAATGTYMISAGCFSTNSCSGTVAFTIQGSFSYSASNTNSATVNTVNHNVYLRPAQNITLGTCNAPGASGTGDTFLRLFDPANANVASNDDSCGLLSNVSYNVPAGVAGTHQIHAGCFSTAGCSGTVGYLITQP